nr:MAG TPA: hypothetical protein [Caudoviricetes sp.]
MIWRRGRGQSERGNPDERADRRRVCGFLEEQEALSGGEGEPREQEEHDSCAEADCAANGDAV